MLIINFIRKKKYSLIVSLISIVVPIFWYNDGLLMTISDFAFPLIYDSNIFFIYFYAWADKIAPGIEYSRGVIQIPYHIYIFLLSSLGLSLQIIQHIFFSLLIFASIMYFSKSIFLFCKNSNRSIVLLLGFLYVFNPYSLTVFFGSISLTIVAYLLTPAFQFYFLEYFYLESRQWPCIVKLSIVSLAIASCGNPIFLLALIIINFLALFVKKAVAKKINYYFIKKIILFAMLILLINFYWIGIFSYSLNGGAQETIENNIGFKDQPLSLVSSFTSKAHIIELLQLKGFWSLYTKYLNQYYFDYTEYYNLIWPIFFIFPAILFILLSKSKKALKIVTMYLAIFIISIFLIQGTNLSLGNAFYKIIFKSPLAIAFRNPMDKFGTIFVFSYIFITSILIINYLKINKRSFFSKILLVSLITYVGCTSYPLFSGKIFRKEDKNLPSYYVKVPPYYYEAKKELDKKKLLSNLYPYPYIEQYFGTVYNWPEGSYQGIHPSYYLFNINTLGGTNKNAIDLFKLISKNEETKSKKILAMLNIRHVIYHDDFNWEYHTTELKRLGTNKNDVIIGFNNLFEKSSNLNFGELTIYNNTNFFLPYLYTPKNNIISKRSVDELPRILSQDNCETRSAVFFENQNPSKNMEFLKGQARITTNEKLPVIEFKKINPTKYRVRVHSANGKFPLVFSESFHEGWRAYVTQVESEKLKVKSNLESYRILDGNNDDQASKEELEDFIQKGWVSELGDGKEKIIKHSKWNSDNQKEELDYVEKYNIDFVSRNFQDTIQNDNLPKGNIFETWFQKPLPEENHLVANGYANSWVIDVDEVCDPKNNSSNSSGASCVRNDDGSYDFEMVVEFWPQRLFYIGAGISGLTLLACLLYLGYDWRKKRKLRVNELK